MATDDPTATPAPEGAIMSSGDQPRKEELDLVHEIDKKLAPTATRTGKREPDAFGVLEQRLFSLISRLQCVVKNFEGPDGDYYGLPNEFHPAAFVLGDTIEDLNNLHGDLEQLHHEHTPKAPKEVQS